MTASDAAVELDALLKVIPFKGSSVPNDPDQARRYALRCEKRWKDDQVRILTAMRSLDIASGALLEALSERRPSRLKLALALGEVQTARDGLLQ